jgi:hypothetical protein
MSRDWMLDARCAQIGGDGWFPEMGSPVRDAKQVCVGCPVAQQCLDVVMSLPSAEDTHGIFGGLSVVERRKLRRAAA